MGCRSWRTRRSLIEKIDFSASSMTVSIGLRLVVGQLGQVVGGREHPPPERIVLDDVRVGLGVQRGGGLVDQRQQVGRPADLGQLVLLLPGPRVTVR